MGALILVVMIGFANGSAPAQENPVPILYSISPDSIVKGNDGITMTLFGDNFVTSSVVKFNNVVMSISFISLSELEATIAPEYLSTLGIFEVIVFNPLPGGGTSDAKLFKITSADQLLISLSPATMRQDAVDLVLYVTGENFNENCVIRFAGIDRVTTFVSSSELRTVLLNSDLENVGHANVTVYNFGSGGETNPLDFEILYGTPVINEITPSIRKARSVGFSMIIKGSGFAPMSTVYFDQLPLTTTYLSSIELVVQIPQIIVDVPATYSVTVTTPAPGGGTSNNIIFTVVEPIPEITAIDPNRKKVGSQGYMMKIEGTDFISSTKVFINGSERITTFVNSNLVFASVLSDDLGIPGQYPITVQNNGLTSSPAYLLVYRDKIKIVPSFDKVVSGFDPEGRLIARNYPNPFNPQTEIYFELTSTAVVTLQVYNSVGQQVGLLINKSELSAGVHSVRFDANALSSGQYFYRITSVDMDGNITSTMNKMILIK